MCDKLDDNEKEHLRIENNKRKKERTTWTMMRKDS